MSISKDNFMKLVELFIESNQLGSYSLHNYSITLYDIKNDVQTRAEIRRKVEMFTNTFTIIPTDTKSEYTNIKILDIGL